MDAVRETAKKELKRREWASHRGKATRTYIREHLELAKQFDLTGTIDISKELLPKYVTRASIILELNQRARRRELTKIAKLWIKEHPNEAAQIVEENQIGR